MLIVATSKCSPHRPHGLIHFGTVGVSLKVDTEGFAQSPRTAGPVGSWILSQEGSRSRSLRRRERLGRLGLGFCPRRAPPAPSPRPRRRVVWLGLGFSPGGGPAGPSLSRRERLGGLGLGFCPRRAPRSRSLRAGGGGTAGPVGSSMLPRSPLSLSRLSLAKSGEYPAEPGEGARLGRLGLRCGRLKRAAEKHGVRALGVPGLGPPPWYREP